ncbi:MAG: alpha/beta hydrolase [Solobacterium sp.]|nr:alpha/beta hydrolase [Solobacterium sp.]MBQ9823292.1 alpha/beta hydrolase [Solobacterium sp.]
MGNLFINIIGVFLLIMLAYYIWNKLHPGAFDRKLTEKIQNARKELVKADEDRLGRRVLVPRETQNGVAVNLYVPSQAVSGPLPVVFVAHGGQFMDGDADTLDSFCDRVKDIWDRIIVNINYTTLDVQPIPYPQEEIRDTVLYFAVHASEFNMDPHRFSFLGFSAGAYLLVGAAAFLKEKGFSVNGMISFYPFIDDSMIKLADAGAHVSPLTLVTGDTDQMKDRYPVYKEHLRNAGVELNERKYTDAKAGFIEYNNEEYEANPMYKKLSSVSEEQKEMARAYEIWMAGEFERFDNSTK